MFTNFGPPLARNTLLTEGLTKMSLNVRSDLKVLHEELKEKKDYWEGLLARRHTTNELRVF